MKKLLQKKTLNSRNLVGLNNQELRQYVIAGMTKKQRKIWNKLTPKEQEKLLKQVEKRVAAKLSGRNGVRDAKSVKTGRLQKTGKNQPSSGRNNKGHPVGKRRSKSNPPGQTRAKQNSVSVKRSMDGITSRQIKTVRTVPTVKKAAFNQRAGIPVSAVQKQNRYRNHGFKLDSGTRVNVQPGQSIPLNQANTQRGSVRPSQNVIIRNPDHVSKNGNHNRNTDGHYSAAYNSGKAKSKKEYEKQFNKQLKKISKKEGKLYKAEFARSLNAEIQKITGKEKAQSDKQREKTFEEMSAKGGRASIRLATMPFAFPLKMKAEKMIAAIAAAIGSVVASVVTALLPLIAIIAAIVGVISFIVGFFGTLAATWDPASDGLPDAAYVANTTVQWAEYIAENDSHGYNDGYFSRWGPTDYSNITFVVTAFDRAGLSLKKDGASSAGDLYDACMANGFLDVKEEISAVRDLKKGDLFIKKGSSSGDYYLAIYCGDRKMVRALYDENGNQKHGEEGDQTGSEISIVSYTNKGWDYILRYYGDMTLYGGIGQQIAEYAQSFVGRLPYVYGGTSLVTGADCSGFVQAVYAHFGYSIPRTAGAQYAGGRKIGSNVNDWQPGDLIYYSRTGSVQEGGGRAEHIVIYIGNGKVVGESNPSTGCVVYNWNYRSDYVGTARYLPDFDASVLLTGNDNATKIWNYLRRTLGCSRAAAAGVMGSIYAESGYDPGAIQPNGVGHGICQWSWDRWYGSNGLQQFANSHHKNWNDLALQLAFFKHEIVEGNLIGSYYPGGWQKFKALTSVDGEGGSAHVFFYSCEYGDYVSYSTFTSSEFERNFACTSKRLGIAMSVYRNQGTYP